MSSYTHLTVDKFHSANEGTAPSIGCWDVAQSLLPPHHSQASAGNSSTGLHSLSRRRCLEASLPLHPHLRAKAIRWQPQNNVDFVSLTRHAENTTEWQVHHACELMYDIAICDMKLQTFSLLVGFGETH